MFLWLVFAMVGVSTGQMLGHFSCLINGFQAVWTPQQILGINCTATLNSTFLNYQPRMYFHMMLTGHNDTYLLMLLKKNPAGEMYTPHWIQSNATTNFQKELNVPPTSDIIPYMSLKDEGNYIFLLFNKTGSRQRELVNSNDRINFNPIVWLNMNGVHDTRPLVSLMFSVTNRTSFSHPPVVPPYPVHPPNFPQPPPVTNRNPPPMNTPPPVHQWNTQPPVHQWNTYPPSHINNVPPSNYPHIGNPTTTKQPPFIFDINKVKYHICYNPPCFRPLQIDHVLYSSPNPNEGINQLPKTLKINGTKFIKNGKTGLAHYINGTLYVSGSSTIFSAMNLVLAAVTVSYLFH